MTKLLTYDKRKNKMVKVGEIQGEALFKNVNPAKHLMRMLDGYGIQYEAFVKLREKGIKKIIIKETTGNQWEASLDTWNEHSSTQDFGSGKQVFLSLKYMSNHKKVKADVFNPLDYLPKPKVKLQGELF